jgi:integrase
LCQAIRVATAKRCLLCGIPHKRHTFAVRTLLSWYQAGDNVEARLPVLSTYLGHRDPRSTYWYLSAAPELLALAARQLERAQQAARR